MNRTIRDVLLFGAGFAAGAYVMHTVFRTKYQEYADAQIDDVRDHYRKKEADLDTMIEEKAQQKSMEQLTGKYRTESDPEDIAPHDPIEIIQPDEFGDIDDYETRGLTYYADGKLVFDEETMPVNDDDIPNIIGTEALNHFGEFMPSTIHVRNNNYHKDYEIMDVVGQRWTDQTIRSIFRADDTMVVSKSLHMMLLEIVSGMAFGVGVPMALSRGLSR